MKFMLLYMEETCPLADPDVGIVSENDHKVGACLCALCTCGTHICPGRLVPSRQSSFVTSYKQAFPAYKSAGVQVKCPSTSPYRPNHWKFEGETCMQRDFRRYDTPEREKKQTRSVSPMLTHSVSYSSYQRDFPNWGPTGVPTKFQPSLPVHNNEMRFQGTSTYDEHFLPRGDQPRKPAEPKLRQKGLQTIVQLPDSTTFAMGTTSRRDYTDPMGYKKLNKRVKAPPEEFIPLQNPACHHSTTSRVNFPSPDRNLRPVLLRRQLQLRRRLAV